MELLVRVGIATRLRVLNLGIVVRFLVGKETFLSSKVSIPALGFIQSRFLVNWGGGGGLSERAKRLGRDADHSLPSTAEVNNE
jgi:hypothetical protein